MAKGIANRRIITMAAGALALAGVQKAGRLAFTHPHEAVVQKAAELGAIFPPEKAAFYAKLFGNTVSARQVQALDAVAMASGFHPHNVLRSLQVSGARNEEELSDVLDDLAYRKSRGKINTTQLTNYHKVLLNARGKGLAEMVHDLSGNRSLRQLWLKYRGNKPYPEAWKTHKQYPTPEAKPRVTKPKASQMEPVQPPKLEREPKRSPHDWGPMPGRDAIKQVQAYRPQNRGERRA